MTNSRDFLDKLVDVIIDKPLGSRHSEKYPNHIYPVNYGYVPNTISGDNEELDCYILGVFEPLKTFKGKCIAIIHRTNDEEIRALTEFQERFFESEIIRNDVDFVFNKNIPELSVSNLENSLIFYTTLGFKVEYERPENRFVFLSMGDIQFMLQELSDNDKWNLVPLTYPFGNGINFQLEVENLDEIYNSFKNSNYKITFDIEENWYRQDNKLLGNKEFLIQDPDGYLLRFSEDL